MGDLFTWIEKRFRIGGPPSQSPVMLLALFERKVRQGAGDAFLRRTDRSLEDTRGHRFAIRQKSPLQREPGGIAEILAVVDFQRLGIAHRGVNGLGEEAVLPHGRVRLAIR